METPIPTYTDYPKKIVESVDILIETTQDVIKDLDCETKYVADRLGEVLFENWKNNSDEAITPKQFQDALLKAELDSMLVSLESKGMLGEVDGNIFLTEKGEAYMKEQLQNNEETNN